MGRLDPHALGDKLEEDLDAALPLLVDLAHATDRELRRQVQELAARLLLPAARRRSDGATSGSSRLVTGARPGVDLDADATIERLADRSPDPASWHADDLRWRAWKRPTRAYVLLLDASGSTTGKPLATGLVTAAALAGRLRPGDELAVVAFWSRAVVLRHIASPDDPTTVLRRLLDLRGGDTTDLALGLRVALGQAASARAGRREVLVLTDGQANEGDDPLTVACSAPVSGARLHALAIAGHDEAVDACARLAAGGGGRTAPLTAPSLAPGALAHVLADA